MLEVDARMSAGVLITLEYDTSTDKSFVTLCDEFSSRRMPAKDKAEAIEMFKHPFAYSQGVNDDDIAARAAL